jgi:hypothetical protein
MLTILNTFSRNHTCTSEVNLAPIMHVLSIQGKLHLYKYANHPSSKVQNFQPTIIAQHDRHFHHQQAITQLVRNPLHHQTQINSIAPMNNKPSKAYGLFPSTTLQMPDHHVVCHLLPFIYSILEFLHSIHPQKRYLTLFQRYRGTCVLKIFKTCTRVGGKLIIKIQFSI